MSLREQYCAAQPFAQFIEGAVANADLWRSIARRAVVPPELVHRAQAAGGRWHLLVIAEDWCGDAVNTVPVLARLAELAENIGLRVVSRDAHPDLMDAHRSPRGAAAIPVVILLDEHYAERGWWGSRPAALQAWVDGPAAALSKEDRYREARRWYAQDHGMSALHEILLLVEAAASLGQAA